MKNPANLTVLLVISLVTVTCCVQQSPQDSTSMENGISTYGFWDYDSAIVSILSDSVSSILFAPDKVSGYVLDPLTRPDSSSTIFEGYVISKELGVVNAGFFGVLQNELRDTSNYRSKEFLSKCAFAPDLGLSISNSDGEIKMFFNTYCGEIGFLVTDKLARHEIVESKILEDFVQRVIQQPLP